jgi:MscS family membrane protein
MPVAIAAVAQLVFYLGTFQINPPGLGQKALDFAVDIAQGVALVWALWLVSGGVAEAIIASPRIGTESLDAHLVRLAARVLGILVIAALGFRVAAAIGVPVYGLVAGAGVGGIAVALAAKSTLENVMGALNLFVDRPVGLGDLCRYDRDQSGGWRPVGRVESIGLRSTKIRKLDRSLLTIPNAEFAQRDILNLSACDRFLLTATLGLRYEATDDQLRIMKIVQGAGTGFAFPSRTLYVGRDSGLDDELKKEAERKVREWAAAQTLPFPDLPEADRKRITDALDYPPDGSLGADLE